MDSERWHHQQHIRDAVGRPGLTTPRFLSPALVTFIRALRHTFRGIDAPAGTAVQLTIFGDSGGTWAVVRAGTGWTLYVGVAPSPAAHVTLDQAVAWRLCTKGDLTQEAEGDTQIEGDIRLGRKVLDSVAIITAASPTSTAPDDSLHS